MVAQIVVAIASLKHEKRCEASNGGIVSLISCNKEFTIKVMKEATSDAHVSKHRIVFIVLCLNCLSDSLPCYFFSAVGKDFVETEWGNINIVVRQLFSGGNYYLTDGTGVPTGELVGSFFFVRHMASNKCETFA